MTSNDAARMRDCVLLLDAPRSQGRARMTLLMCGIRLEPPLHRHVQRFQGGLVFKAHRLCELLLDAPRAQGRARMTLLVFGIQKSLAISFPLQHQRTRPRL